jgi:hypothetical protein
MALLSRIDRLAMKAFGTGAYYSDPSGGHPPSWFVDEDRLRRQLPRDTQDRVERTSKMWNRRVRDRLGIETGLRLTTIHGQVSVPVKVVDGLPLSIAKVFRRFDEDLWWLMARRHLFTVTREGISELCKAAGQPRPLLRTLGASDTTPAELDRLGNLIEKLLGTERLERLDEEIRSIDEDVLGAYFFRRPEVQLYWMVIGFYTELLGVTIEDLTLVVLTHELAHAYTHLGADIDGSRWDTEAFSAADLRIVEGLAQSYTETVLDSLAARVPGAKTAFDALLMKQSKPYTNFKEWAGPEEARGEVVRAAMI